MSDILEIKNKFTARALTEQQEEFLQDFLKDTLAPTQEQARNDRHSGCLRRLTKDVLIKIDFHERDAQTGYLDPAGVYIGSVDSDNDLMRSIAFTRLKDLAKKHGITLNSISGSDLSAHTLKGEGFEVAKRGGNSRPEEYVYIPIKSGAPAFENIA